MKSEIDIQSVARLIVLWYRADAAPCAALQRDWLLEKGDLGGFEAWKQVVNAIEHLQANRPSEDDAVA